MATKEEIFVSLRRDYLERKLFLKRQLIALTQLEIETLEKEISKVDPKLGAEA